MEELKCIIEMKKIENDNKVDCLKNEIEVERERNNKNVAENKELKLLKVEIDERTYCMLTTKTLKCVPDFVLHERIRR